MTVTDITANGFPRDNTAHGDGTDVTRETPPAATGETTPSPTAVRASDRERDHVVAHLREAVGEGRLTLAEAEDRIIAAYAAVHRADLVPLTADLPRSADTRAGTGTGGAGARPVARRRRHHPPLFPVLGALLALAWIASPLPFPWPVLLIAFLVLRHRAHHRTT
ncbi:DUF1707 SHOCT-like domain-containing protein [Saccharothrix australiensis]|uniref:Uncharacterized protein DUF1707 n=1 Tax=Saccharothrix australiensis TaxID=2072 RepID=A0A495W2M6_9PSEU|nr:DUF1707 domain-containing protein [Saccharothrix australiensis]RKT54995.1 uncharacterized protein DUF1707 [Saccharothrix australiensis]